MPWPKVHETNRYATYRSGYGETKRKKFLAIGGPLNGQYVTGIDIEALALDYSAFNNAGRSHSHTQVWLYEEMLKGDN